MLVIFYAVWIKLLDKKRLLEILLFGSFVSVMVVFINIAGTTRALWQLNIRLFPILPAPFPFDFSIVPILLMLAYQYSDSWAKYIGWNALAIAAPVFAIAPLYQSLGIQSVYIGPAFSYILLFAVGLIGRWAILAVLRIESRARQHTAYSPSHQGTAQPAFKPRKNVDN